MRYLVLIAFFLVSGCAGVGSVKEVSDLTIQVTEYRLLLAEQAGGLWLGSDERLAQAKAAYAAGDYKTALALSRQVRFEGEMAQAQHLSQQDAAPWQF